MKLFMTWIDSIKEANNKINMSHLDSQMFIEKRKLIKDPNIPIELSIKDFSSKLSDEEVAQINIQYQFLLGMRFFYIFRRPSKDSNKWEWIQLCRFEIDDNWNVIDFVSDNIDILISELFHRLWNLDIVRRGKSKFKIQEFDPIMKKKVRDSMLTASASQRINEAVTRLMWIKKPIIRKYTDLEKSLDSYIVVEKWSYWLIQNQNVERFLVANDIVDEICVTFWNPDNKNCWIIIINQSLGDIPYNLEKIWKATWMSKKVEINIIWWRAFNPSNFAINANLKRFLYKPLILIQKYFDDIWVWIKTYDIVVCHGKSCDIKSIALDRDDWTIFNTRKT